MTTLFNIEFGAAVDEHGNPVECSKMAHPYSYSPFVVARYGANEEATDTVYHDRMMQWDYKKYRECFDRHFKPDGDFVRTPKRIEAFLRDYHDAPNLRLILVMEYCNWSSGYPCWRFDFTIPKEATEGAALAGTVGEGEL